MTMAAIEKKEGSSGAGVAAVGKKKKSSIESVPRPDENAYRDRIQAETKAVEDIKAKINEIQKKISDSVGGKDEYNRKKSEMRANMDELQQQISQLENERKTLVEKLDAKQREGREMKNNAQNLKKSIGFSSEDDITSKIRDIEERMMTSTMPLKEEKKMMIQIAQLKASKPLVGKLANMDKVANTFEDNSIIPLKARLDIVREELNKVRDLKRIENEKYRALVQERQNATQPVREFFDERDVMSKEMNGHITQRKAILEELNQEMKKWQEFTYKQREASKERIREEKIRRAMDNERQKLERQLDQADDLPLEGEVLLLEQTIKYVKKLSAEKSSKNVEEEESDEKTKSTDDAQAPKSEGVALLPKNKREEEYFYAPKAAKKVAKKPNKNREKSKNLKHDIGTLSYFEQCGVAAPVSQDDIPSCLKNLEEKLEQHKEVRKTKLSDRDGRKKDLQAQLDALEEKFKNGTFGASAEKASNEDSGVSEEAS